ncbi:MAG: hypothetical protein CR967_03970 [Proteobacteria bacterium]|nr:MAG: hypothetical protein CR967_03970 [Pseudomonadota bacterium]
MATGIFVLFDDIALLADDVALTAKMATKKTAAILGDDLAVNAEKATGFSQDKELKVIWAITKGSLLNKIIILPFTFILNYFASWAISIALICGGLYLLYEGAEKIYEVLFHKSEDEEHKKQLQSSTSQNVLDLEKKKIRSAIFTDFILSIEIVVIALSSVSSQSLLVQILSTSFVALIATVGVYGLVALIIRLDNVGFWFIKKGHPKTGQAFVDFMPLLIRTLGVIGTIAMFLVGGGILAHNIEYFHHFFIAGIPSILNELLIGIVIGIFVLAMVMAFKKLFLKS